MIFLQDGFFAEPIDLKGIEHIVLLSQVCNALVLPWYPADSSISMFPYEILIRVQLAVYRNSGGLQAIMNSKLKKLAEKDEEVVLASGIPCTIIRTGSLQSTPGGERGFDFTKVSV